MHTAADLVVDFAATHTEEEPLPQDRTSERLVKQIQSSIIGGNLVFQGAFGPRPCIYADWTASGRALDFLEDYIRDEVLPFYGNTHTTSSITGLQVRAAHSFV